MNASTVKRLAYFVSLTALVFCAAAAVWGSQFPGEVTEDLSESVGAISAVFLGFDVVLYLAVQLFKSKRYPAAARKWLVWAVRQMNIYHNPACVLALSFLAGHIVLELFGHPAGTAVRLAGLEYVTGYVSAALVLVSVLAGVGLKLSAKAMRKLHTTTALMALVPFGLHLVGS